MNITDNLIRIKTAKADIINSLKNKGVDISDNTLINEIPTIIDNVEIGGGGDTPSVPTELVPKYDGASVFRIEVPNDNYEFTINLCNNASTATFDVDWGDGSLESGLTTDEQRHTYSKVGTYDVNIYNISKDITLGGSVSASGNSTNFIPFLFNNSNNDFWCGVYIVNNDCICTNILIGKGITSIASQTFQYYVSLQSIEIPNSVTSIGYSAFASCSSLQSIVIPEGVTKIEDRTFEYCYSLSSIIIPEGVTKIGSSAFASCFSLQSIVIPNSVTTIGNSAFGSCESLQSVNIPNNITSIASQTFQYCDSLQSVEIPNSVTSIGNSAFASCSSLQSIVIPDSVTSISTYAFSGCKSLQTIVIPDSVTAIESNVFNQCSSLQSITCNTLTAPTIQSNSFPTSSFKYSKRYLYVPKDSVGYNEGNWKTKLIDNGWELRYIEDKPEKIPTTLKLKTTNNFFHNIQAIGQVNLINYELINDEYIYNFDDKIIELVEYNFYNKVLEEIELPEGLEIIGTSVFSGCSSLTSVNIPNSVTSIGNSAFASCSSLQSIVIPNSVTTIGNSAFGSCSSLQSIVIPNSVTTIGNSAFAGSKKISTIICNAITAPTIQSTTFNYIYVDIPSGTPKVLRVPEGSSGYDSGYWKSTVLDKGYTLEYVPLSEL